MNNSSSRSIRSAIIAVIIGFSVLGATGLFFSNVEAGKTLNSIKSYFSGSATYVASVDAEVAAIEKELEKISKKIVAGTLTESEAIIIRDRLSSRLATISASAEKAEAAELTPEMRATIGSALTRLGEILNTYRGSLTVIDEVADTAELSATIDKPKLNVRGSTRAAKRLSVALTDTISDVEDLVVEIEAELEAEVIESDESNEPIDSEETTDDTTYDPVDPSSLPDPVDPILAEDSEAEQTTVDEVTDAEAESTEDTETTI